LFDCRQRDETIAAKQPLQIVVARAGRAVSLRFAKRFAEHGQHRLHEVEVRGAEPLETNRS
jgi:hypothetical protein